MENTYYTERLIIKVLDESYASQVLDYYTKNKDFLEEWEPSKEEEFYTIKYHEQSLNEDLNEMNKGNCYKLWLFKKDEPNKIIGSIAFNNIVRGPFQSCFLGYKLDKDEINKGYITEAIQKGIKIMFDDFGLHRIEANIMPKNIRSLRVVEKLGFYNEGLARQYLNINGVWEDHIHMVLLNN